MTDIKKMTEFELISEIGILEKQRYDRNIADATSNAPNLLTSNNLQRLTLLRHQLKLYRMKSVSGAFGKAVEDYWKKQVEESRKKQLEQKKKDDKILQKAKKQAKEELKKELTVEELEKMIAEKKEKHDL